MAPPTTDTKKEGAPPRTEGTGSANPHRAKSRIKLYGEPASRRVIGEDMGTRDERRRRPKKVIGPKSKARNRPLRIHSTRDNEGAPQPWAGSTLVTVLPGPTAPVTTSARPTHGQDPSWTPDSADPQHS